MYKAARCTKSSLEKNCQSNMPTSIHCWKHYKKGSRLMVVYGPMKKFSTFVESRQQKT